MTRVHPVCIPRRCLCWRFVLAAALLATGFRPGIVGHARDRESSTGDSTQSSSIIFISDTQAPLWIETIKLQSDDNEQGTRALFQSIAAEPNCRAVFHLGDLVSMGWSQSSWSDFDEKSAPLSRTHLPLYPTLGNHEYMFWGPAGKVLFTERYPGSGPGWFMKQSGGIGVIILNSNFSHLSASEEVAQQEWYEHQLRALDADTSIVVVLVGCHHPPYTNSTIVDPSDEVQQHFVPPFLGCRKARLFLSGHTHAAEHFKAGGKDFVVIGGGGGLLHPLLTGERQRWKDLFSHDGNRSFFHYLRITRQADSLVVAVVEPRTKTQTSGTGYRFTLTIP